MVDIDILKDGGATWTGWLEAARLSQTLHNGLGQVRGDLFKRIGDSKIDIKQGGGVEALQAQDKAAANELFDTLSQYGLFVVRKGELEQWLSALKVPGKKTDWTISMLDRLGADPNDANYIHPASDDVWDFMRNIVSWIRNPGRKGTA